MTDSDDFFPELPAGDHQLRAKRMNPDQPPEPKLRALMQRVLASENGVRLRHPDPTYLRALRGKIYNWRTKQRKQPGYDKQLDLLHVSVIEEPTGWVMVLKFFDLDDYDIEDIV